MVITPVFLCIHCISRIRGIFMDSFQVYRDMKARTNGEIYIGVVGPVRTGKIYIYQKDLWTCLCFRI